MESKDGLSGALGFPEAMLRYGFNERVALKMDFQWDIRFYHLAEDNNLTSKGYVKIENLIPDLQIEYEPIKGLTFYFGVRRYFGRKLTVFDYEENELTSNDDVSLRPICSELTTNFRNRSFMEQITILMRLQ